MTVVPKCEMIQLIKWLLNPKLGENVSVMTKITIIRVGKSNMFKGGRQEGTVLYVALKSLCHITMKARGNSTVFMQPSKTSHVLYIGTTPTC